MSTKQGSGDVFSCTYTKFDLSNSQYLQIAADYGIYAVPSIAGEVLINILLTINAPKAPEQKERSSIAVSLVIDKSGSMCDAKKLDYAKIAGKALVQKLEQRDKLSIVVFDEDVNVIVPISAVNNKQHLEKLIDLIQPGSLTNISGGLQAGIQLPEEIAAIAAAHRVNGVSVSTVGLGLDYNETLMQLVAQRGGGQYYYCSEAVDLSNVFDNELSLALNAVTKRTSAILAPPDNKCICAVKIHDLPTQKQGSETKIDVSDLTSGEERLILLQITVDPSVVVKQEKEKEKIGQQIKSKVVDDKDKAKDQESVIEQHVLSLGEIRFQFSRTEGGAAELIELPLSILVDDDEDRRDLINGDEQDQNQINALGIAGQIGQIGSGGRNHVQSIERVTEFVMTAEADAARTRAVEEMERGNSVGARYILNAHRQRQQAIQQATLIPQNYICSNKADLDDEQEIESSSSSSNIKDGEINVSEKTKKSAVALASFMSRQTPELQIPFSQGQQRQQRNSQISQKQNFTRFAAGDDEDGNECCESPGTGLDDFDLQDKECKSSDDNDDESSGLGAIDDNDDELSDLGAIDDMDDESSGLEAIDDMDNELSDLGAIDYNDDETSGLEAMPNIHESFGRSSIPSKTNTNIQSIQSPQVIPSIIKPPPITLLPAEQATSLQGKINRALFKQQQDLDEIE
ncbi:MAG: putative Ca-activated chloride channel family protein, partial [Streblomastix strix]